MTAPPSTRRHTATPWALFHANGTIAITNPRSHSSKNEIVFWTGFDASHYPKEALANAAFIVTAVNSHAALTAKVAELEAALRQIKAKTEGDRPTVNPENAFGHWSNLNAALVIIRGLARAALEAKP